MHYLSWFTPFYKRSDETRIKDRTTFYWIRKEARIMSTVKTAPQHQLIWNCKKFREKCHPFRFLALSLWFAPSFSASVTHDVVWFFPLVFPNIKHNFCAFFYFSLCFYSLFFCSPSCTTFFPSLSCSDVCIVFMQKCRLHLSSFWHCEYCGFVRKKWREKTTKTKWHVRWCEWVRKSEKRRRKSSRETSLCWLPV